MLPGTHGLLEFLSTQEVAEEQGISAMPTFMFYRNSQKVSQACIFRLLSLNVYILACCNIHTSTIKINDPILFPKLQLLLVKFGIVVLSCD